MQTRRRHRFFAGLIKLLLLGAALTYGVTAITAPWALHIGGRLTPFLYWSGSGKLVTQGGTYPLFVSFFPASHFSRLRMDGLRPTGGVQGTGSICTPPGVMQHVYLSGSIYNGWSTTQDGLITFRLLESKTGRGQGYFNLYGRFQGQQLLMDDRGEYGRKFRSGLQIEHASVALNWNGYFDFKSACENGSAHP